MLLDLWRARTHRRLVSLPSGKRRGGGHASAGVLSEAALSGALPVMQLRVDGKACRVLIDTGSTDTIVFASFCARWRPRRIDVTTISGGSLRCLGVGSVDVETPTGRCAALDVLVVDQRPLGADMVLGMSGISALGGVTAFTG